MPPQIRISACPNGYDWHFSVADNGIGFDPQYAEKIFGVFKRLHARNEYPGNGIGLAICTRIVAHYGGRIWAESKVGQGSVFHFSLPAKQEAA
jgi:light-regulated signal transduction histidine kinase (bacteriophytochrome)